MNNTAYEATNSDEQLIAEMKAAAEKATSGEWWSDVVECDGTYGNGDECAEGFHSYAVYDSNNQTLLDMTNSTAACIQVDCDDESHYAWDEVAERNAEYIVLARPENVLKLIAALEQAQRNAMRYQFIRDKDAFGDEREPGLIGWDGLVELDANEFDAAIDARMAHPSVAYAPAPNGMMQLSNELAEMKQTVSRLRGERDTMLRDRLNNMELRPLCVKSNDAMREAEPLCVKLPDSSSKAFWSGIGKTEQFHPETYKRWVKEAIERAGSIAGIKVEVK